MFDGDDVLAWGRTGSGPSRLTRICINIDTLASPRDGGWDWVLRCASPPSGLGPTTLPASLPSTVRAGRPRRIGQGLMHRRRHGHGLEVVVGRCARVLVEEVGNGPGLLISLTGWDEWDGPTLGTGHQDHLARGRRLGHDEILVGGGGPGIWYQCSVR
jgi:hypothetical protein